MPMTNNFNGAAFISSRIEISEQIVHPSRFRGEGKHRTISARVTDEEYEELEAVAKMKGWDKGTVVLQATLLYNKIHLIDPKMLNKIIVELNELSEKV